MNGNAVMLAWVVGLFCGAAVLVSRWYMMALASYVAILLAAHLAGLTLSDLVADLYSTIGFVLLAIGVTRGVIAIGLGK